MTEKHLKDVFKALPEKLDDGELCALTLTLHSAFIETPQEIITNLISTIYTYGASQGISSEAISYSLRLTADLHDIKQTKH
jgi:hypothetical protein